MSDDIASLLATEAKLKAERKAIDAQLRAIEAKTKAIYREAFHNQPASTTAVTFRGIDLRRRVWRNAPRTENPLATVAFLVGAGADVFSAECISKGLLDKNPSFTVNDGAVFFEGEPVPYLKLEKQWTYSIDDKGDF